MLELESKYIRFSKEGGGGGVWGLPLRSLRIKKWNEMKAFPLRYEFINLFFTFLQCSQNPQNYKFAPQIPEIITSAAQLPENI